MSAEFTVSCAAKAFSEWVTALEELSENRDDITLKPAQKKAIWKLSKAVDKFNSEFSGMITR